MSETPKRGADLARWRELASDDLRGADPDRLVWETPEGLNVKALYTAADIDSCPNCYLGASITNSNSNS